MLSLSRPKQFLAFQKKGNFLIVFFVFFSRIYSY